VTQIQHVFGNVAVIRPAAQLVYMLVDQGFSLYCTHAQDIEVEINNLLGEQ
jgi:hypothetical protein